MSARGRLADPARDARPARYLLVNHIPLGRGPGGTLRIGDLWLRDLRAQVASLAGIARITLAAPVVDEVQPSHSGSFHLEQVSPRDEGFEVFPLPYYVTVPSFLRLRGQVRRRLSAAVAGADLLHAGSGGHPWPYGQIAWGPAGRAGCRRLFVLDGSDEVPRRERRAIHQSDPVRRAMARRLNRRFEDFCRGAVRDADLVLAHNAAVQRRYADVWSGRAHVLPRTFVSRSDLCAPADLAARAERLAAPGPLVLAAVGRQVGIKCTDHVLRAMDWARRRGADVRLLVLGEGEELPAHRRLVETLGLGEQVEFLGARPFGPELFQDWERADATVITNVTPEISRNVLLSLARGLPVVGYRNPGHDALLDAAGAARLVPMSDEGALGRLLLELAVDRGALVPLAERGVAAAAERTLEGCHALRARLVRAVLATPPRTGGRRGDAAAGGAEAGS